MDKVIEKQNRVGNKIFEDVIEKKIITDIKTNKICSDLNLDEEEVSNYFLGTSKQNLLLGLKILNYLEEHEENKNYNSIPKVKVKESD